MFKDFKTYSSFSAADIPEIKEFYTQKLGLEILKDMGDNGAMFKTAEGGSFMVYVKPNHIPAEFTVLNFVTDDIESAVKELTSKGIVMEKYDYTELKTNEMGIAEGMGFDKTSKMAWFKDPAGNIISVGTN